MYTAYPIYDFILKYILECNKVTKCLWLLLIPFTLSAQRTISGRVIDAEDKEPIVGVSVFISNTTTGTVTDQDGQYLLTIPEEDNMNLTVSHVGYQPVFKSIEPGATSIKFDVAMKIHELKEVTVSAKIRFRQKDIDLFWKTILGKLPSKKTIYVVNPENVYYYFNSETGHLKVTCRDPLTIINNETGYEIQFVLYDFAHDYNTNVSTWESKQLFTELKPENFKQKTTWEVNRKNVYKVSMDYFIKSLYHNTLMENGFLLTYPSKADRPDFWNKDYYDNTDFLLSKTLVDGVKILHVPPVLKDLLLVCFGRPITDIDLKQIEMAQSHEKKWSEIGLIRCILQTPNVSVRIFQDGSCSNTPLFLAYLPSKSLLGLNMRLPKEYNDQ